MPKLTNTTFLSLIVTQHTPEASTTSKPSKHITESYVKTDSSWPRLIVQQKTATLQTRASTHMKRIVTQNKYH